jgi:hypothetical protein
MWGADAGDFNPPNGTHATPRVGALKPLRYL